jgi:hemoglobin-like flavoprotein
MTLEYESAVRASWDLVRDDGGLLTGHFYRHLFALDPALRALFAHSDEPAHSRKLLAALDEIMRVLDEPHRLVAVVIPLGMRHAGYGVTDRDYETATTAFVQALQDTLGDRLTPDMERGWREVHALISEVMRRAGHSTARV